MSESFQIEAQKVRDRVAVRNEIKDFLENNSEKTLGEYAVKVKDKEKKDVSKFLKTKISQSTSRHLSSTVICTYALTQCGEYCKDGTCFGKNKIDTSKNYWKTIMDILKTPCKETDFQAPDEFTILNVMSLLAKIKSPKLIAAEDRDLIERIILELCMQFIENQFIFKENRIHPFLYYRFYRLLKDWEPFIRDEFKGRMELKLKGSCGDGINKSTTQSNWCYRWFYSKIYDNGKYEMYRQIALYFSDDMTLFDVKRLIYSLLIVSNQEEYSNNLVIKKALEIIFEVQLPATGLLPIGHVVDNDFIFIDTDKIRKRDVSASPLLLSFECFAEMISENALREELEKYEPNFKSAYEWVKKRLRKEDGLPIGWFPEYESTHITESWVSGHVLIFLKKYCDFLESLIPRNPANRPRNEIAPMCEKDE